MSFINGIVWPEPLTIFFHFRENYSYKNSYIISMHINVKIFCFTAILCCSGLPYASKVTLVIKLEFTCSPWHLTPEHV